MPLFTKQRKLVAALLRVAGVTAGLADSSLMAVYRRVYDSRYLFVFYYTRQLTRNHCVNLKCKIVNASKINKYSASITVTSCRGSDVCPFLLRDSVLARYLLLSGMCPSVCPSQAGIVSKRLDESSQVLPWGFFPPIPHCVIRKFGYSHKLGYTVRNIRILTDSSSVKSTELVRIHCSSVY